MTFLQSVSGAEPVVVDGLFNAPVERVFAAWTEPDEIKGWFGIRANSVVFAEIDLRVGGRWRFGFAPSDDVTQRLEGEYLEIAPNARLVFTWVHVRAFADGREEATSASQVTVTFETEGKATRVRVSHEGIREEDGRRGVGTGWDASFANLQTVLTQSHGASA